MADPTLTEFVSGDPALLAEVVANDVANRNALGALDVADNIAEMYSRRALSLFWYTNTEPDYLAFIAPVGVTRNWTLRGWIDGFDAGAFDLVVERTASTATDVGTAAWTAGMTLAGITGEGAESTQTSGPLNFKDRWVRVRLVVTGTPIDIANGGRFYGIVEWEEKHATAAEWAAVLT